MAACTNSDGHEWSETELGRCIHCGKRGGEGVGSSPLRDLTVGPGREGGVPAPSEPSSGDR